MKEPHDHCQSPDRPPLPEPLNSWFNKIFDNVHRRLIREHEGTRRDRPRRPDQEVLH